MDERLRLLYMEMIRFDHGDPELIQHFTKVHAYCQLIAEGEHMPADEQYTLEAAALVHDIAIPLCREKYGTDSGHYQQIEGPALVRDMLPRLGFDEAVTERVCWLVAHHHTYTDVTSLDHRILLEADFLVNAFEGSRSEEAKRAALTNFFRTRTGTTILREMFAL